MALSSIVFIKDFMIQGGDPDSKGAPKGKMLGTGVLTIPSLPSSFIHNFSTSVVP